MKDITDLKNIKDITDKLAAIGVPISEEHQVVSLLGSLLRSFATLVTPLKLGWMVLAWIMFSKHSHTKK